MPRFTVLPIDPSYSTIKFSARDAGKVLPIFGQLGCREADIHQEGRYAFTVRLDANGVWAIYQRRDDAGSESIAASG
jgi:hypothetical protein